MSALRLLIAFVAVVWFSAASGYAATRLLPLPIALITIPTTSLFMGWLTGGLLIRR